MGLKGTILTQGNIITDHNQIGLVEHTHTDREEGGGKMSGTNRNRKSANLHCLVVAYCCHSVCLTSVICVVSIHTLLPTVEPNILNHAHTKGVPRIWLMKNGFAKASMIPTHNSVRHTKLLQRGFSEGT